MYLDLLGIKIVTRVGFDPMSIFTRSQLAKL